MESSINVSEIERDDSQSELLSCGDAEEMDSANQLSDDEGFEVTGKRHICKECGKSYLSLQKYLDHVNKHTGSKP
jgi:hypothetical protein